MSLTFQKATKKQAKLRLALIGPSGSGKTFSALSIGCHLGSRVAVVDTERGSASKYADLFEFDALELQTFEPLTYVEAIGAAAQAGYDVLVIDSLSHAWMGKGGALDQVDRIAKRSSSSNSFAAWRDVTPQHNALVDAILGAPMHVVVTMRAKTEYVLEKDERTGKTAPRKVGLAAVQRDGMEYEFDVVGDLDLDNGLTVSKTRCSTLTGAYISKPGKDLADVLARWLSDGEDAPTVDRSRLDAALARLAELDDVTDYHAALDKASHKDHGRPLALLTQTEIDGYADRMETHAAKLEEALHAPAGDQGSGEGPSGPPRPPADDATGSGTASSAAPSSSSSPDNGSDGTPTGAGEGSDGEAATSAADPAPTEEPQQESMFAAPQGARGSRSRKPKETAE